MAVIKNICINHPDITLIMIAMAIKKGLFNIEEVKSIFFKFSNNILKIECLKFLTRFKNLNHNCFKEYLQEQLTTIKESECNKYSNFPDLVVTLWNLLSHKQKLKLLENPTICLNVIRLECLPIEHLLQFPVIKNICCNQPHVFRQENLIKAIQKDLFNIEEVKSIFYKSSDNKLKIECLKFLSRFKNLNHNCFKEYLQEQLTNMPDFSSELSEFRDLIGSLWNLLSDKQILELLENPVVCSKAISSECRSIDYLLSFIEKHGINNKTACLNTLANIRLDISKRSSRILSDAKNKYDRLLRNCQSDSDLKNLFCMFRSGINTLDNSMKTLKTLRSLCVRCEKFGFNSETKEIKILKKNIKHALIKIEHLYDSVKSMKKIEIEKSKKAALKYHYRW